MPDTLERYYFTPPELDELKDRVVALVQRYQHLEDDKKARTKELSDELKSIRGDMEELAFQITEGYELRARRDQTNFAFGGDELRSAGDVAPESEKPKRERKQ